MLNIIMQVANYSSTSTLTISQEPNGVYSKLDPKDDPYRELGELEEKNLLEFARQIAAGMVGRLAPCIFS